MLNYIVVNLAWFVPGGRCAASGVEWDLSLVGQFAFGCGSSVCGELP